FVAVGVAYGLTVGSIAGWADLPEFMVKGMKDVAPVLVLFFIAAQFIAWFEWSNIGTVLAVSGADLIESLGVATPLVMVGVILMTFVLNLFITSGSAQWTLMAPVIVPAMMLLGVSPETSQVLFRIGDSGSHLITPLNVYFALMLTYLQRYRRDAGIGTLVSMTLPVRFAVLVGWTLFGLAWFGLGIPLGPGAPGRGGPASVLGRDEAGRCSGGEGDGEVGLGQGADLVLGDAVGQLGEHQAVIGDV